MTYKERKERARQKAIDWQYSLSERRMSYGEIADETEQFERLGRRYGLVREFRENGII
jgi:hypothetical protein